MLSNPRGFIKFLYDFKLPTLSLLTSILSKLLQPSNLLSFFLHLPRITHSSSTQEGYGSKPFQDFNLNLCPEREPQMIRLRPFKKKEEGEGRSPLANGRRRRRFQCLEANGRGRKVPFHLFPLSPQATLLRPLCFSFEIKVLLYHGSRPSFTHFLPFPWPINYDCVF
jgi:hypothetical protein